MKSVPYEVGVARPIQAREEWKPPAPGLATVGQAYEAQAQSMHVAAPSDVAATGPTGPSTELPASGEDLELLSQKGKKE